MNARVSKSLLHSPQPIANNFHFYISVSLQWHAFYEFSRTIFNSHIVTRLHMFAHLHVKPISNVSNFGLWPQALKAAADGMHEGREEEEKKERKIENDAHESANLNLTSAMQKKSESKYFAMYARDLRKVWFVLSHLSLEMPCAENSCNFRVENEKSTTPSAHRSINVHRNDILLNAGDGSPERTSHIPAIGNWLIVWVERNPIPSI